jgi:hypothetical protein
VKLAGEPSKRAEERRARNVSSVGSTSDRRDKVKPERFTSSHPSGGGNRLRLLETRFSAWAIASDRWEHAFSVLTTALIAAETRFLRPKSLQVAADTRFLHPHPLQVAA